MAYLRCDECGASTNNQGSWDTPIKILCEKCYEKLKKEKTSIQIGTTPPICYILC
jgi:hypothetical protein